MSDNKQTLSFEIKRTLHLVNYKVLVLGSLLMGLISLIQAALLHPEIMYSSLDKHFGFTLSMAGVVFAVLLGMIVGTTALLYCLPRAIRVFNFRKELDHLQSIMVSLASYVATIDGFSSKTWSMDKLKKALSYTARELKSLKTRVDTIEKILNAPTVKQLLEILDSVSADNIRKQKKIDKYQKTLDEFSV